MKKRKQNLPRPAVHRIGIMGLVKYLGFPP